MNTNMNNSSAFADLKCEIAMKWGIAQGGDILHALADVKARIMDNTSITDPEREELVGLINARMVTIADYVTREPTIIYGLDEMDGLIPIN